MSEMKPVVIVGAGPTGMTAAMELSRFGIPVRKDFRGGDHVSRGRSRIARPRTV